jgi:ATP-dependent Clp protease ATP-binding subunit ClpC
LGRSWAYGYTVNLDKVGIELGPALGALKSDPLMHAEEFQQIESILARARENNVLIVGEPGVGRTIVVEDFARLLHQGRAANVMSHKRLIELNLKDAPTADMLGHVLAEAAYAGNIILVLPMFENYAGHIEVLAPYLKSSRIQIIAITSYAQLHGVLERSPELLGHFEKVEIKEPDASETLQRVFRDLESFESRYKVFVPYPVLKALVQESDRYIQDTPFPKKAFDLLDRAISTAAARGDTTLTRETVEAILAQKTEIPIARPGAEERNLLVHLEEKMHERLIGQEEAVSQIADALRRARVDVGARNRPVGSFLFLGPTGVGKTETAKALARLYYGDEKRMIRLDMSEFQEVESIARLIGDIRSNTPGVLTTAIRESPASLVLLDEVEKAHPDILNLFLQVIDDARLTDAWGRTVKFTSACIIATSNAGAERIRETIKNGQDLSQSREAILDELQAQGVFRPEFLNRFDGVILFRPLSEAELEKIALLLLSQLATRLQEQQITFVPTPELAREIAKLDYQPEFGARALRRTIQDRVESPLAKRILAGTLTRGAALTPRTLAELG